MLPRRRGREPLDEQDGVLKDDCPTIIQEIQEVRSGNVGLRVGSMYFVLPVGLQLGRLGAGDWRELGDYLAQESIARLSGKSSKYSNRHTADRTQLRLGQSIARPSSMATYVIDIRSQVIGCLRTCEKEREKYQLVSVITRWPHKTELVFFIYLDHAWSQQCRTTHGAQGTI